MRPAQQGFLLLTSHLGDPKRKCLSVAAFRKLAQRVQNARQQDPDRDLNAADLMALGYGQEQAEHIVCLLSQTEELEWYLKNGAKQGCIPITRLDECYPAQVRRRLGLDAPGCLWSKGDLTALGRPAISLVGSRELNGLNQAFAYEAGRQAALQGYVLVSGNAKGADREAQTGCLEGGGQVISIVADCLAERPRQKNVLYLSEDGYDMPFSAQRALSRNRVIHSWGQMTLVAQCTLGKGGTWDGTVKNLKYNWSPVFCLDDGSEASIQLEQLGAVLISGVELLELSSLRPLTQSFF